MMCANIVGQEAPRFTLENEHGVLTASPGNLANHFLLFEKQLPHLQARMLDVQRTT